MGCTSSVQVFQQNQSGSNFRFTVTALKLQQNMQIFSTDELSIEELLFVRQKLLQAHTSLGLFNKDKHKKLQYVKLDQQLLKKLYELSNPNNNNLQAKKMSTDLYQIPINEIQINNQGQKSKDLPFAQVPIRSQFQKYLQNLSVFLKNGSSQNFVSFSEFVKMYAIFTRIPTRMEIFGQVLFNFLAKGVPYLSQSQFRNFLSSIQTSLQQFQAIYKQEKIFAIKSSPRKSQPSSQSLQNSPELIIPSLIQPHTFKQYLNAINKSETLSKRLSQFQQSFSLTKNTKAVYSDYFRLKQLMMDQKISFSSAKSEEEIYVVSHKWYDEFLILFNSVFETKILKIEKKQSKLNFIRVNTNRSSGKKFDQRRSSNSISFKSLPQPVQNNHYVKLMSHRLNHKEIEGQYRLQLKKIQNPQLYFKPLSKKLYFCIKEFFDKVSVKFQDSDPQDDNNQLDHLTQNKVEYPRKVLSSTYQKIDYYPNMIYLVRTNKKGKIIPSTIEDMAVSSTMTLKQLKLHILSSSTGLKDSQLEQFTMSFFIKQPQQKNFRQETNHSTKIKDLSSKNAHQFLMISITSNRVGFIGENTRKSISRENLTLGDIVFAYSEKYQSILPAYVIGMMLNDDSKGQIQNLFIKVHFLNKSWRDQVALKLESVYLSKEQFEDQKQRPKQYTQLFTGMHNIGNTCYINSSIQSLLSTTVFSSLLKHQPINTRLFSHQIQTVFSHLLKTSLSNSQISQTSSFSTKSRFELQFNQKVVQFFKQFQHYEQQDTQQFIHAVLDKISSEHRNFIERIFRFQVENQLVCSSIKCDGTKINKQAMTMITLPIPEPKQIYLEIIVVPIYKKNIQKILIKLQQQTTLGQLLKIFEERCHLQPHRVIMVEIDNGVLKTIRKDLNQNAKDPNLVTLEQLGIYANFKLIAFEIIKEQKLIDLARRNSKKSDKKLYYDLFIKQTKEWTISKIPKLNNDPVVVKYIDSNRQIVEKKISQPQIDNGSYKIESLGTKTLLNEQINVKLLMRKLVQSPVNQCRVMQPFGIPFIITIPLSCTYNDALLIIYEQLQNVLTNAQNNEDYVLRFVQIKKQQCIFCETQCKKNYIGNEDILKKCCKVLETDVPLLFLSKFSSFVIYLDWKNIKRYNSTFISSLIQDRACKVTQQEFKNQKVSLHECFNILRMKEVVEMTCQKCKHSKMFRQQSISTLPPVLIIQLKEYRYVHGKQAMVKLNTNLNYDQVKLIDIDLYLAPNSILRQCLNYSSLYELYSVIQHVGSGNSGHYTSICKRKLNNNKSNGEVWVFFDDKFSSVIDQNDVQNYMNDAYMLFYRKKYLSIDARLKLSLI